MRNSTMFDSKEKNVIQKRPALSKYFNLQDNGGVTCKLCNGIFNTKNPQNVLRHLKNFHKVKQLNFDTIDNIEKVELSAKVKSDNEIKLQLINSLGYDTQISAQ